MDKRESLFMRKQREAGISEIASRVETSEWKMYHSFLNVELVDRWNHAQLVNYVNEIF